MYISLCKCDLVPTPKQQEKVWNWVDSNLPKQKTLNFHNCFMPLYRQQIVFFYAQATMTVTAWWLVLLWPWNLTKVTMSGVNWYSSVSATTMQSRVLTHLTLYWQKFANSKIKEAKIKWRSVDRNMKTSAITTDINQQLLKLYTSLMLTLIPAILPKSGKACVVTSTHPSPHPFPLPQLCY